MIRSRYFDPSLGLELLTVKAIEKSTNGRKSLLSIGKRISSYFSRDLRNSSRESLHGVEKLFRAERSFRTKALECMMLADVEWKVKKAGKLSLSSSFVVLPYRWVSHSWRWIVTIRICRDCKPVPELPRACRKLSYRFPISSDSSSSFRWPVGIPDSEELTENGQFCYFSVHLSFTINIKFYGLHFFHCQTRIPTVNSHVFHLGIPCFWASHILASADCPNFPK